jgi:hypothetical protein
VPLLRTGLLLVMGGVEGPVADCARTWVANVRKMLTSSKRRTLLENDISTTAMATTRSDVQNGGNGLYK